MVLGTKGGLNGHQGGQQGEISRLCSYLILYLTPLFAVSPGGLFEQDQNMMES